MIVSIILKKVGMRASVSALKGVPKLAETPGLRWATMATQLRIGVVPPRPQLGRVGLIAVWNDDDALDSFLEGHPWGAADDRYEVRLELVQAVGSWSAAPELALMGEPMQSGDPVGVLTLGRLKVSEAPRFFQATARAEKSLLQHPGLLASTGLARPPFLSTFSLWRTVEGMTDYAYRSGGHKEAVKRQHTKSFHHESIFIRLRPYRATGVWNGVDPLAGVNLPGAR